MSVLIKGMEMPKHCWQCPFHDDVDECILLNQSCMVVWGESKRLEDCPLVEAPKWIPVTERLPKENGFYLCLYKHKASGGVAMDEGLSILQWINNKWGINDIYLVTHWMPIPQPPKDGES